MKVGSRKFALDSSLERGGFELPVPRGRGFGFPREEPQVRIRLSPAVNQANFGTRDYGQASDTVRE